MLVGKNEKAIKVTEQQARFLKLLFKFRFVNATYLSKVIGIRSDNTYKVLEKLVGLGLATKVYESSYRIDRKPAYYYLNKHGVTLVRQLMDVKESVVHALYSNDKATEKFIEQCQTVLAGYTALLPQLPTGSEVFTRTEINRFKQFPKTRPDLYIRTPDGREAFIIVLTDSLPYFINKRRDQILTHSDEEGWSGHYPTVAFVLNDNRARNGFLFKTNAKLENMGMDESEMRILAAGSEDFLTGKLDIWYSAYKPMVTAPLL